VSSFRGKGGRLFSKTLLVLPLG
jgi:hypothetical protein